MLLFLLLLTCLHAIIHLSCRIPSLTLLLIYSPELAVVTILVILGTNFLIIFRQDPERRQAFSVATSVTISVFTPFMASDKAHVAELNHDSRKADEARSLEHAKQKKLLSAKVSVVTVCLILIADVALLLVLKYKTDFIVDENVLFGKEEASNIILWLLVPTGCLSIISSIIIPDSLSTETDPSIPRSKTFSRENAMAHLGFFGVIFFFISVVAAVAVVTSQLHNNMSTAKGMCIRTFVPLQRKVLSIHSHA